MDDVKKRKQLVINILLPLVLKENEEILAHRRELLRIKKTSFYLTLHDMRFIEDLASRYRVSPGDHRAMLDELLMRVDIVPASLVIAQAAIESEWGTSRYALEGNNIFGLKGPKGVGMVPKAIGSGCAFSLSTFQNLQACIGYYLWNINTNPEYRALRQMRSRETFPYDSVALASGLHAYSETGYVYVGKVIGLIKENNLQMYDLYRLNKGQVDPGPVPAELKAVRIAGR